MTDVLTGDEKTITPTGIYSVSNIKRIAYLLDDRFRIPFTRYRVGWDFIIGLIPFAGDLITSCLSLFLLFAARKYRVPRKVLWKMLGNIAIDFLLGLLPVVGDFIDAAWKANARNARLLLESIEHSKSAAHKDF